MRMISGNYERKLIQNMFKLDNNKLRFKLYSYVLKQKNTINHSYENIKSLLKGIEKKNEINIWQSAEAINNILREKFIMFDERKDLLKTGANLFYTSFPWIEIGGKTILNRIAITALIADALREVVPKRSAEVIITRIIRIDKEINKEYLEFSRINHIFPSLIKNDELIGLDSITPYLNPVYKYLMDLRNYGYVERRNILPEDVEDSIVNSVVLSLCEYIFSSKADEKEKRNMLKDIYKLFKNNEFISFYIEEEKASEKIKTIEEKYVISLF